MYIFIKVVLSVPHLDRLSLARNAAGAMIRRLKKENQREGHNCYGEIEFLETRDGIRKQAVVDANSRICQGIPTKENLVAAR